MSDREVLADIVTGEIDMEELKERILQIFMGEIQKEILKVTPVDKGNMRGAWHEQLTGRHQITYSNDTSYLPFHLNGTGLYGPHNQMICAKGMSKRNPKHVHVMAWRPAGKQTGPLIFRRCIKGMKKNAFIDAGIENGIQGGIEVLTDMFMGANRVVS
jgi:hypothetical protein